MTTTDPNTQRVNAAIRVAVRRAVAESPTVGNQRALEIGIGRRLQGTYGAELRRLADSDPALSVAELCEAVIFPAEYPDDLPEASAYTGDRDRARRDRPNAASPADGWPDGRVAQEITGWRAGLAAAKACVIEPGPREVPDEPESDPWLQSMMAAVRAGDHAEIEGLAFQRSAKSASRADEVLS
jgi:hypothetical protein